jgi:uncharacterized protein (TIGR00255 family)
MISMTGYGLSEYQDDRIQVSVEIKSYNNRYLDISVYMPSYLNVYEAELRELVRSAVRRGHVDLNIKLRHLENDAQVVVDKQLASRYREAFSRIAEAAGIADRPKLSDFLESEELLKLVNDRDAAQYKQLVFEHSQRALASFVESRRKEGERTYADIRQQLEGFEASYAEISGKADMLEEQLKSMLRSRFEELVGQQYEESRILQEVALLLNKYTIHEEIQRLESHLKHFAEEMETEDAVGKRLDFLCQELNREINTIASKSIRADISQAVVTMKDMLENIREQLKNVE